MFRKGLVVVRCKRIRTPKLTIKRPIIEKCSNIIENIKIKFNKKSNITLIKPLVDFVVALNRVKYGVLYSFAAIIMMFLIYGTFMSLDLTFADTAMINGQAVGIVTDKEQFEQFYMDVHEELKANIGDGVSSVGNVKKITYMPCISFAKSITDKYTLRQNIMSLYDGVASAYAVYVDDVLICAAFDKAEIDNVLNDIKSQYGNVENAEFIEKVEVKNEYVTTKDIRFGDNIRKELTDHRTVEQKYVVRENDTLWEIATRNNMTIDELEKKNPGISGAITPGTQIVINAMVPLLSVKTKVHIEGEYAIACSTQVVYDDGLSKGKEEVVTDGKNGLEYVDKEVISVNGDEVSETVFNQKTITEPVTKVVRVGTRPSGIGTGTFVRPTYGTLSSRYGQRWNRQHQGIDISAPQGTDINAADEGVVEFSGYETGYGNIVKINHGNGYETYYGHCSELLVAVGDVVEKGDLIAKVGSTGRSTGPHLHFEVRINGVPQNPLEYIDAN